MVDASYQSGQRLSAAAYLSRLLLAPNNQLRSSNCCGKTRVHLEEIHQMTSILFSYAEIHR